MIWALAFAGIILTIAKLDIPRWLTSVIYLVMGWLSLAAIVPLVRLLPTAGMVWLVLGGVLYTVGGVLYAVKWPGRNNPASATMRSSMCSSSWALCAISS